LVEAEEKERVVLSLRLQCLDGGKWLDQEWPLVLQDGQKSLLLQLLEPSSYRRSYVWVIADQPQIPVFEGRIVQSCPGDPNRNALAVGTGMVERHHWA
jgi:hypothetical protein